MERKGVDRLLADGADLAARLEAAADGAVALAEAVTPSLELIESEARDAETGLRLMDIWRYMRLHWSIPYQSTPGRNLFYLVRDDAGPQRPVVGIAALGNAVLGLTARDRALGLTAEALQERFHLAGGQECQALLDHLRAVLKEGFASVLGPTALVMQICDEDLGLQPDNFSIKPVHLANGLARALIGETNDTTALAQTLRRWVRDQRAGVDRESNPTAQILERYPTAFRDGIETEHERVRSAKRGLRGSSDS